MLLTGADHASTIWVNPVPEPVTVKQRVHLDVHVADVTDALGLGATPLDLDSFAWQVLRDPEGGELCVFPASRCRPERVSTRSGSTAPTPPVWRRGGRA